MPQSVLEYTNNINVSHDTIVEFFKTTHKAMVTTIGTSLESCKSSALEISTYCIGDMSPDCGFLVLKIQILPGRTVDQIKNLKKECGCLLQQLLIDCKCNINVQVRVLVTEVSNSFYLMEDYPKST